jgi:hypothetical protein
MAFAHRQAMSKLCSVLNFGKGNGHVVQLLMIKAQAHNDDLENIDTV